QIERMTGAGGQFGMADPQLLLPLPCLRVLARLRKWRWHGTSATLRLHCQRGGVAREASFRIKPRGPASKPDEHRSAGRCIILEGRQSQPQRRYLMDKHWTNYCTMSIVHFMAYPETIRGEGPILETVAKIAEDPFFGAIEMGWIKAPAIRKEVKKMVDTSHIQVGHGAQSALLLQKLNLNSLDDAERMKAVKQLQSSVDEAAEMGAQRVAFLSGVDPGDAE